MSKVVAVIGAQWGDEGKGKIVDLLAEQFEIVARYQGGHNAGHSVQVGDQSFVLHLLPSGIVHRGKTCVLGNGMVIDPKAFFIEADRLMEQGIEVSPERVKISSRAHLILPYHRALDHTSEERLGNEKVGTTLRGIGPAYEDKAGRRGIRTADALVPDVLHSRIKRNLEDANRIISAYGGEPLNADEIFKEMSVLTERLGPFIADTTHFLNVAASEGKSILLEGAQATLLDVDHGTYPFVTSSTTVAGGAIIGTGLAPNRLSGVLGIVRTYTTRVGEGPFPTEMLEGEAELGQMIRERGREYGASTGRPRRCGWFDAFATRYAAEINGFTSVALTKLDVLDTLDEIKVCVGYKLDGRVCESLPPVSQDLRCIEPIYQTLPGWQSSTLGMTEMNALPRNARAYVDFLSSQIGVEIGLISTGPERSQTIIVRDSALGGWLNQTADTQ
ncbi:MAG TPA: adenylosuccinate synthase [Pyrinomonadaceae bacterium]|jgi:adenylosuccinate synthase|nr:adenylosuccinate synthase [Pyrinomonadaceae bacterium]